MVRPAVFQGPNTIDLRDYRYDRTRSGFGGETDYKLTNIQRVEPAHSLFEVPPEYVLREGAQAAK